MRHNFGDRPVTRSSQIREGLEWCCQLTWTKSRPNKSTARRLNQLTGSSVFSSRSRHWVGAGFATNKNGE
jgi:hypothetical protein